MVRHHHERPLARAHLDQRDPAARPAVDVGPVAGGVEQTGVVGSGAADQLQRASRLLRENSVEDLLQMAVDLAEERPLVFTGGAVAVGFLLTRFLRSSTPSYDESEEE